MLEGWIIGSECCEGKSWRTEETENLKKYKKRDRKSGKPRDREKRRKKERGVANRQAEENDSWAVLAFLDINCTCKSLTYRSICSMDSWMNGWYGWKTSFFESSSKFCSFSFIRQTCSGFFLSEREGEREQFWFMVGWWKMISVISLILVYYQRTNLCGDGDEDGFSIPNSDSSTQTILISRTEKSIVDITNFILAAQFQEKTTNIIL